MNKLTAQLEALLFIYGDPIDVKKAAEILGVTKDAVDKAAHELVNLLIKEERGLVLLIHSDKLQLATKPEFSALLEKVMKAELTESLTPASLETLAIIAYASPIGRAEIDYIRGVNSSYTLRALLIRGLIDRHSDPKRGNAFLYGPSFDLLKYLGIYKLENLPEYEKFRALAESIKTTSLKSPETPANKQEA